MSISPSDISHDVLTACPIQAGSLITSLKDLSLSVEWQDLRSLELPGTGWAVIIGHKRRSDPLRVVLPLPLQTTALKPSTLKSIFASLYSLPTSSLPEPIPRLAPDIDDLRWRIAQSRRVKNGLPIEEVEEVEDAAGRGEAGARSGTGEEVNNELDREMIYIAIVTSDSTVVYYKLSKGIKKPADIPDE